MKKLNSKELATLNSCAGTGWAVCEYTCQDLEDRGYLVQSPSDGAYYLTNKGRDARQGARS